MKLHPEIGWGFIYLKYGVPLAAKGATALLQR